MTTLPIVIPGLQRVATIELFKDAAGPFNQCISQRLGEGSALWVLPSDVVISG